MAGDQQTQVRGGTGIFTGPPLFVWISNQLGNTGVLQGSLLEDNPTTRPFTPNVDAYKPATVTGAPAASYEFDVTDNNFKFPQVWRNNIAVDRRLPEGSSSPEEFVYNKDVNGIYYINANLPAAQSAFTGVDASAPVGRDRLRRPDARAVRDQNQQRRRKSGHRRLRHEEPERRPLVEPLDQRFEIALPRLHR